MKTLKFSTLLLTTSLFLMNTSCQKNMESNNPEANQKTEESASARLSTGIVLNACLITHTQDDDIGASIDFVYNQSGNPASITFNGTLMSLQYDLRKRLVRENISSKDVSQILFIYPNLLSTLPSELRYISAGGLTATDKLSYNGNGQLIFRLHHNLYFPATDFSERFTYDYWGNVLTIDKTINISILNESINGGTTFREFTGSEYDRRPNFMTGSSWTKFALFYSGYEGTLYQCLLFSTNNMTQASWSQRSAPSSISCSYKYDAFGFATGVQMHVSNSVGSKNQGDVSRTSLSTCDADVINPGE